MQHMFDRKRLKFTRKLQNSKKQPINKINKIQEVK